MYVWLTDYNTYDHQLLTSVVPYFARVNIGNDVTTLLAGAMLLVGLPVGGILANYLVRR